MAAFAIVFLFGTLRYWTRLGRFGRLHSALGLISWPVRILSSFWVTWADLAVLRGVSKRPMAIWNALQQVSMRLGGVFTRDLDAFWDVLGGESREDNPALFGKT